MHTEGKQILADVLTTPCNYSLLKENLQVHCPYWYDCTKFPVHSTQKNHCIDFVSCQDQAAAEREILFSFNLTVT